MCDDRSGRNPQAAQTSDEMLLDSHHQRETEIFRQAIEAQLERQPTADPGDRFAILASKLSLVSLAQEAERRRLAEALHDQVLQSLALGGIELQLALKKGELPDNEAVRNLQRTLQTSIQEIRNLCLGLSPPILYDIGLKAAIRNLGERLSRERGFNFVFETGAEEFVLREDLKIALFQIARELLVNAAKHSGAERLLLRLCQEEGVIRLSASDNGVGFLSGSREGFGLANMKVRVRDLGGKLSLTSAPRIGTRIEITVPSGFPSS